MKEKRFIFALLAMISLTTAFGQEDDDDWFLDSNEKEEISLSDNSEQLIVTDNKTYNKAEQMFNFVYIAHDATTPVQHLLERMRDVYRDAIRYNNAAIFYLSNGNNPIIVRVNVPGDNRDDFDNVLAAELQEKNSHDIIADEDLKQILNLVQSNEIATEFGGLLYNSVSFDFYVNQNYWTLQNNEAVISALYFVLNVRRFLEQEKEFYFSVYHDDQIKIEYEGDKPFGEKDIDEINKFVKLLPY